MNELRNNVQASVDDAKSRKIELQKIIDDGEALLVAFPAETAPTAPVISSFTATPNAGAPGVAVTLAWTVTGATTVTIDQGVGTVAASGTKVVTPAATLAYKLTATNAVGSVNQSKTVTVTAVAPPPPPPVGTLPVSEDESFTLSAATVVRYGVDTRWVQKSLPAGTHVCGVAAFGQGDPAFLVLKRCEVVGAAPPPAPPPPPPAPPPAPPPGSDIFDAAGALDPVKYRAIAGAMGTDAGLAYLFGSAATDVTGLPTCPMPAHQAWPTPNRPGTYQFGTLVNPFGGDADAGAYSSDIANAAYIPDNTATHTGAVNLGVVNVSNSVFGFRPELSWTTGTAGANGVNATKLRDQGIAVGRPVAACRTDGRPGWALRAFIVDSGGLIYSEGSNTASNNCSLRLPANKKPLAIAVSNSNEFLAVAVWDTDALKGQIAIIAMAGLGDGGTVANPDSHPLLPNAPPNELKGWWGDPRGCYPGISNLGNIAFMKVVGYVELLDMKAPSSIQFVTGKEGSGSIPVWNGGYLAAGGDLTTMAELTPWTDAAKRANFMTAGQNAYEATARQGLIMVASKSEQKLSFIDANPLFDYYTKMYFTTPALFSQTANVGDGALWPFTFTAAPEQVPTIIKTVTLPGRPNMVKAYASGPYKNAWVALENGDLQLWGLGDYPGRGTRNPASILLRGTMNVGRNPTDIALPKEKAGGNVYPDRYNEIIVTCRGDRAIKWVRYSGATGTVVRTMRDSRLVDPISATDSDNHTSASHVLVVADGNGKAIRSYRYGMVQLNQYPGNPVWPLADGSFEFGGEFLLAGKAFNVTSANIP